MNHGQWLRREDSLFRYYITDSIEITLRGKSDPILQIRSDLKPKVGMTEFEPSDKDWADLESAVASFKSALDTIDMSPAPEGDNPEADQFLVDPADDNEEYTPW